MPEPDVFRLLAAVESSLDVKGKLHPEMTILQMANLSLVGDWIDTLLKEYYKRGCDFKELEENITLADFLVWMWENE